MPPVQGHCSESGRVSAISLCRSGNTPFLLSSPPLLLLPAPSSHHNQIFQVDASQSSPTNLTALKSRFSDTYTNVKFLKLDVDELSEVAAEWSVSAMPTFLLFKNGEKVGEVVGANARALEAEIKKAIES